MKRSRFSLAGVVALLACLLVPASSSAAVDTLTVNDDADPGDGNCATNGCTLREAVNQLNLDFDTTDQDRININIDSIQLSERTITLGSTLTISDPVAIADTGFFSEIIDGNDAVRPFTISPATPGDDVSISGVAITDGLAPDSGAGVHTGGAISSSLADLTIIGSAITSSSAPGPHGSGGGINASGGSLTIERSTVSGNTASATGGGSGRGGGINSSATLTIRRSTISGNQMTSDGINSGPGGGIATSGTTVIESSTISGNSAQDDLGHGGGAAFSTSAPKTIRDSTVFGNSTQVGEEADGGGLFTAGGDVTVSNTIVAGNTVDAGAGGTGPDLEGSAAGDDFLLDYSLVGNTSGAPIVDTVANSNIKDQSPALGPLTDNGGPNSTHLPGVTSPVLDKGRTDAAIDQRGFSRPNDFANIANRAGGDAADIGAVEIQIGPPTFTSTTPASPSSDDTPTIFGDALDGTVRLYTDPACTQLTGAPTADEVFEATGITASPVPHNATTTFYGRLDTTYGTSLCSAGPFPNTISYTHADVPAQPPAQTPVQTPVQTPTQTPTETCAGTAATITGTSAADRIMGTPGPDVIVGLSGNDTINAGGGNDLICGGAGKDKLNGGNGKDKLLGQGGRDTLKGGGGNDTCKGGKGRDVERSC